jgi:arthrofactin-type cyclic lipopeptide synthetase C
MSMLAVFAIVLHSLVNTEDFLVGIPVSDRRRVEFESVIGLMTNVVIVRIDLGRRPTFKELAARVRAGLSAAYAEQDLPYAAYVQSRTAMAGAPAVAPFRVTFNYMNSASRLRVQMADLITEPWRIGPPPPALADLALHVWDTGDGMSCSFSYNDALFTPERINSFAELLVRLAHLAATSPDCAIDRLETSRSLS